MEFSSADRRLLNNLNRRGDFLNRLSVDDVDTGLDEGTSGRTKSNEATKPSYGAMSDSCSISLPWKFTNVCVSQIASSWRVEQILRNERHVSLRSLRLAMRNDLRGFERMRMEDIDIHLIEEVACLRCITASSAALSDLIEVIDEFEEYVRGDTSNR